MDIFNLVTLLGGLALFLFGMNEMSSNLMLVTGSRLRGMLEKLTANPLRAVLLGAGVTAIIQSSSATTVMAVGRVNAGRFPLAQTVGLIMAANIGTTATAWILSLGSIGASTTLFQLFRPSFFAPIIALASVAVIMASDNDRKKNISRILIGFAIIMFGMQIMSDAVRPLSELPGFRQLLVAFSNPLLGLLVGAVLTALIQSSSATIGILQAFAMTGAISFGAAIPIIMGANIGTCVTTMMSSIGTSTNAKRAAFIHLFFNVIGTITFMALFYGLNVISPFSFLVKTPTPVSIAIFSTAYKTAMVALFLPFHKMFVKAATRFLPKKEVSSELLEHEDVFLALDSRFLDTSGFAVDQSRQLTIKMAGLVKQHFKLSADLLSSYDVQSFKDGRQMEDLADQYEDRLGTYMIQISARQLTDRDNRVLSLLLQSLTDFERISDHSLNIAMSAKEMYEKKIRFSDSAVEELGIFRQAVEDLLDMTVLAFSTYDLDLAKKVEPLEEVIDHLQGELRARHILRLKDGRCTLELGFVLADILTSMERIADHCSNIALSMLELSHDTFEQHAMLIKMKQGDHFREMVEGYQTQYALPPIVLESYTEVILNGH